MVRYSSTSTTRRLSASSRRNRAWGVPPWHPCIDNANCPSPYANTTGAACPRSLSAIKRLTAFSSLPPKVGAELLLPLRQQEAPLGEGLPPVEPPQSRPRPGLPHEGLSERCGVQSLQRRLCQGCRGDFHRWAAKRPLRPLLEGPQTGLVPVRPAADRSHLPPLVGFGFEAARSPDVAVPGVDRNDGWQCGLRDHGRDGCLYEQSAVGVDESGRSDVRGVRNELSFGTQTLAVDFLFAGTQRFAVRQPPLLIGVLRGESVLATLPLDVCVPGSCFFDDIVSVR